MSIAPNLTQKLCFMPCSDVIIAAGNCACHNSIINTTLSKTKPMRRRNLSGVFIFEKFEDEEKREPTCFEDCQESTQDKWLNTLEPEAVKNLAKHLAKTIRKIGDQFDITIKPLEDE